MTAGHNALHGSGPGHKPAFDNAMAPVGCPDRRIDRLCITCCSPFPTLRSCRTPTRCRSRRECDGFLVALTPDHHGPCHSRHLVGEGNHGNLRCSPRQQPGQPRLGTTPLSKADDGQRAGGKQAAQITITSLADTAKLFLAAARVLLRHEPDPSREISARSKRTRRRRRFTAALC